MKRQQQQQQQHESHLHHHYKSDDNSSDNSLPCLVLRQVNTPRASLRHLTVDVLRPYFHLPLYEAAQKLGVSESALKKQCRQLQIRRWPYRKVAKIARKLKVNVERVSQEYDPIAVATQQASQNSTPVPLTTPTTPITPTAFTSPTIMEIPLSRANKPSFSTQKEKVENQTELGHGFVEWSYNLTSATAPEATLDSYIHNHNNNRRNHHHNYQQQLNQQPSCLNQTQLFCSSGSSSSINIRNNSVMHWELDSPLQLPSVPEMLAGSSFNTNEMPQHCNPTLFNGYNNINNRHYNSSSHNTCLLPGVRELLTIESRSW